MSEQREWLSVGEFAGVFGITRACVRRWLLERKLNSIRVGRLVRIHRSEAEQLAQRGLRPARDAK